MISETFRANCPMDMELTVSKSRKIKIKTKISPPKNNLHFLNVSAILARWIGVQSVARHASGKVCSVSLCVCVRSRECVGVSHPITEVWKYWALQSGNISRRSGSASGHGSSGSRRKEGVEMMEDREDFCAAATRWTSSNPPEPGGLYGPTVWASAKWSGNSW